MDTNMPQPVDVNLLRYLMVANVGPVSPVQRGTHYFDHLVEVRVKGGAVVSQDGSILNLVDVDVLSCRPVPEVMRELGEAAAG
jgi:hypothetical protein